MHNINKRNKHHFIDQMPTYLVFKKSTFMIASKFSAVYHKVWQSPQERQGKSPSGLKKIPQYTPLLICRWNFFYVLFIIRFCKRFAVFYTGEIVCICDFFSILLSNILTDRWKIYIYICVWVCVCVCVYTHTKWRKLLLAGGQDVLCTTMQTVCCT